MIRHLVICGRVKDSRILSDAFDVDPLYLKHDNQGAMPDFRVRGTPILLTKSIISQLRTFNLNLLLISFDSSIGTFHLDEGLGH